MKKAPPAYCVECKAVRPHRYLVWKIFPKCCYCIAKEEQKRFSI